MKDESMTTSAELSRNSEASVERMPQTSDIKTFIECLRATNEYQGQLVVRKEKIEKRREELVKSGACQPPDLDKLSNLEVERSWEERDEFKDLYFDFASRVLHLKYDAATCGPRVNELFSKYRRTASESVRINQTGGYSPEQKREAELDRNHAHHTLALEIYENLLPTGVYNDEAADEIRGEIMGRCIARSWLVDQGEDAWASARTMDVVRRANAVPLEQSESVLRAQKYRPGTQRWFERPEDILTARNCVAPVLRPNQLDETAELLSFFHDADADTIKPTLRPQDNQEHASNPLRGERPFS